MTKAAARSKAKPNEVELEVLAPIGRHGERLKKGDRFTIKRTSSRVHVDRWIAQGKLREVDPRAKPEAAPELLAQPDAGPVREAEAAPPESVTRTREQMEAIPMEGHKLSDPRKPAAVRGFEVDGQRYVATGGVSGGGDHGYYSIDANPLIEVDAVDKALVPKVRDHTAGRFFYYGQLVTIKGNFYALGADKLRVRRSDCRCNECTRLKVEASRHKPESPAAVAAAKRAKAGQFVASVPVGRIYPSPWNPRKDFSSPDAVAALDELAQSIREQGIIEPLIVRPLPGNQHEDEGRFEIVAGERRFRAARRAGLDGVPCIVRELDKLQAIRVQAVENLQRRDINALEECEGYELLMREGKYTVKDIVRETGKSEASVYARLKLRDCPPGIRQALAEGRIPPTTAELVARIDDVAFKGAAMDAILFPDKGEAEDDGDVLSFRQAKAWIENRRAWFEREAEWKKRAKDSHVIAGAAKVLSAEESARELMAGGYVKNSQEYVKPTDTCYDDPAQRTYAAIAQEAGRELPAPTVARDPGEGGPVVLLPRGETLKVLDDLIPSAEEQRHRRAAADAKRQIEMAEADRVRKEAADNLKACARAVVEVVRLGRPADWDAEAALWRFSVNTQLRALFDADPEEFIAAVREFGVPELADEDEDSVDEEWIAEYLDGCDLGKLRAWSMFLALRGGNLMDWYVSDVDVDQLRAAETVAARFGPQTSAVADGKGAKI